MVTEGEWEGKGNKIEAWGRGIIAQCPSPKDGGVMEFIGNTDIMVTAINQCKAVNPQDPQKVAERIEELVEVLEAIIIAEDGGFEQLGYGRSQDARQVLAKVRE